MKFILLVLFYIEFCSKNNGGMRFLMFDNTDCYKTVRFVYKLRYTNCIKMHLIALIFLPKH